MRGATNAVVLVLVAAATTACAGGGERRVRAADDARDEAASADLSATRDEAVDEPAPSRPRLQRTVTLGESIGGDAADVAAMSAGDGGDVVDGAGGVPGYGPPGPGGYGYGAPGWIGSPGWDAWTPYPAWGWPGFVPAEPPVRRPASSGRPWSPPPQYGPPFPFKTAPADPWR